MTGTCTKCGGWFDGGIHAGPLCPHCDYLARRFTAGVPAAPVAVDVPPGTPLHELARLAADAPEVRRETVTAAPPTLHVDTGTVTAWAAGRPAVQLPEAEAARRLLAFDALVAACGAWDAAVSHRGCYRCGANLRGEVWFCEEKCRLLAEAERLTAVALADAPHVV